MTTRCSKLWSYSGTVVVVPSGRMEGRPLRQSHEPSRAPDLPPLLPLLLEEEALSPYLEQAASRSSSPSCGATARRTSPAALVLLQPPRPLSSVLCMCPSLSDLGISSGRFYAFLCGHSMSRAASLDADSFWDNSFTGSQGVDEQLSQGSLKMARADTMPYMSG
mmetsp:Transcript_8987/g.25676  ORF Transcript_8987/g.25676 Transcript_8987/m.25676 type:complete len:164 (-) Transcript_8987:296-787(-)